MVESIAPVPFENGLSRTPNVGMQDYLKRKRDDSPTRHGQSYVNGVHPNPHSYRQDHRQSALYFTLRNILESSKSRDTSPSFLQHTLPADPSLDFGEPSLKRAKLASAEGDDSIMSKVHRDAYSSLQEFVADVEATSADLLRVASQSMALTNGHGQVRWDSVSAQEQFISDVVSFQKYLKGLVERDAARQSTGEVNGMTAAYPPTSSQPQARAQTEDAEEIELPELADADGVKYVLSLAGNHQGHKQLFSSFQKSVPRRKLQDEEAGHPEEEDISLHLNRLPHGITATRLSTKRKRPEDAPHHRGRPSASTFGDVFAPPSSLAQITPPKTPMTPSQNSSITWTRQPAGLATNRPFGYQFQQSKTGEWLGYGGLAPAEVPSSPEAKRKKRDRALSSGESTLVPSDGALAAQLQAKEEALFRSVYSSFAPTSDNAASLISTETRSEVWWDRHGKQAFAEVFAIDPALEEESRTRVGEDHSSVDQNETAAFEDAVREFTPNSLTSQANSERDGKVEKETQEILTEISELLETLHSYQRIRNSSLSVPSRTPMGSNTTLQDLTGNPSTPSEAEVETYKTLKSQLALMVSMLPPYAVAKLNGDQLADLNISTNISIEQEVTRGVLEEDSSSRMARQAAINAAVGNTAPQGRPAGGMNTYGQAGAHGRTPQMNQHNRPGAQSQHYGNASTVPRNAGGYSRQAIANWQTPSQGSGATAPRQGYQNYSQTAPRPNSGRGAQPLAQFTQRTPTYPQQNGSLQTPTQHGYQHRAQQPSYGNQSYPASNSGGVAGSPSRMAQYGAAQQQQGYSSQYWHQQQQQYNSRPMSAGGYSAGSPQLTPTVLQQPHPQQAAHYPQRPSYTPQMQQQAPQATMASPTPQLQRPLPPLRPSASPQPSQQYQQAQLPGQEGQPQPTLQAASPFPRPASAKMATTPSTSRPATPATPAPAQSAAPQPQAQPPMGVKIEPQAIARPSEAGSPSQQQSAPLPDPEPQGATMAREPTLPAAAAAETPPVQNQARPQEERSLPMEAEPINEPVPEPASGPASSMVTDRLPESAVEAGDTLNTSDDTVMNNVGS